MYEKLINKMSKINKEIEDRNKQIADLFMLLEKANKQKLDIEAQIEEVEVVRNSQEEIMKLEIVKAFLEENKDEIKSVEESSTEEKTPEEKVPDNKIKEEV